jgi:predicted nuclease of predicted toxin-antitoxin system
MNFLVDVNLPKRFSFFKHPNFLHLLDINPYMTDEEVWDYALKKGYTILTKDSDFYYRSISSLVSPKIIQFRLGNMTLKQLNEYFLQYWEELVKQVDQATLIVAERDKLTVLK